ncbi:50S ribosomal protein L11 methyltransferase [Marinicauda algicola]|nr:50S ribosomal protein L11 methyltransferase [Marinicauda algicola]
MPMNTLWRLVATGPMTPLREAADRLEDADPAPALSWSCFEDGAPDRGRLDILFAEQPRVDDLLETIGLDADDPAIEVDFGPLPEEDWVRLSLEGLKPVEAGRFVVHGAHEKENIPSGKLAIEIEAGPAFGTGHHGTTKGCLIACDRLEREGLEPASVLDLGCGTGVLAIAAAMVWPDARIVASDIDPEAVTETGVNADKNGVLDRIDAFAADGFQHDKLDARFDLIFANILAGPLQDLAVQLADRLTQTGKTVLSGLLEEQIGAVEEAYAKAGLRIEHTDIIEGWAILTLGR